MSRVSPSMAVALLALFVALGGTGYAAAKLNGRDIVNGSITGKKLRRNTLGGRQIKESSLGKVPSAADSDFLDGRPASAYQLAGNAQAYLPLLGTAVNSQMLQGNPAAAFLRVGATAADSALLGGRPASDFASAEELQGAGPVTIPMPAGAGASDARTLFTHGTLCVVGQCDNSGGQPLARVSVQGAGVLVVDANGSANPVASATGTAVDRHAFTALSTGPAAGLQGAATAVATGQACVLAVYAFSS